MAEGVIILNNGDAILLKKALARILYGKDMDQSTISKVISITQPMVSNYVSSHEKIQKEIVMQAEKLAERLEKNSKIKFNTCVTFADLRGEYFVAKENEIIDNEKQKIVNDMMDAFLLLKGKDVSRIMPEVKINLAVCKSNPKDKNDVACFVNGLLIMDNKISSINSVQFGKSKHLASLLLKLDSKAIMNIRLDESFKKVFSYGILSKDFNIKKPGDYDLLFHEGDFGIEPCCYVLGSSAKDVAKKVLKLMGE
jgi:predicted fused transcriptional regulator/phosphomethylpyrimidine kinase